MIATLRPQSKVTAGGFALALLILALSYNGWALSTTLPQVAWLLVAVVVLCVVSVLFLVNDIIAG